MKKGSRLLPLRPSGLSQLYTYERVVKIQNLSTGSWDNNHSESSCETENGVKGPKLNHLL